MSSDQHRLYQKRQTSLLVRSKRKKLLSSHSRYTTDYNILFETKTNVKYGNFNYFFVQFLAPKRGRHMDGLIQNVFNLLKEKTTNFDVQLDS